MTARHNKRGISAVAFVAAAMMLTACGGQQTTTQEPAGTSGDDCGAAAARMTIGTGNSTGVYFVLGGGISGLLNEETELATTAVETGASVQNIEGLVKGDYDIVFSLADTAADAVSGTDAFSEPQPVEALGMIHSNYTQVIARRDANITSIADLAGRTVSTGSPKSGTEVIALRLLQSAGLDPDSDLTVQRLDLGTSVDGLRNGSIDAIFWSGGLPTPAITELFTTDSDSVEFVDITPLLSEMQDINGVYKEGVIPAAVYGLDADTPTIEVPNVLLVRDDFDPGAACDVVNVVWSNLEQLSTAHPAALTFSVENALASGPIPLNDGAQRALEELAE